MIALPVITQLIVRPLLKKGVLLRVSNRFFKVSSVLERLMILRYILGLSPSDIILMNRQPYWWQSS